MQSFLSLVLTLAQLAINDLFGEKDLKCCCRQSAAVAQILIFFYRITNWSKLLSISTN